MSTADKLSVPGIMARSQTGISAHFVFDHLMSVIRHRQPHIVEMRDAGIGRALATPGSFSSTEFWERQQRELTSVLTSLIPAGSRVLYLDYPVHTNVGDLLVLAGTERLLRRSQLRVVARHSIHDFRFPQLEPGIVLLCQGGGNFGDLYKHQAFREKVVSSYLRHRIVFLPQTIHYRGSRRLQQSAQVLNAHADLHLILRDHASFALARRYFAHCRTYLAPDAAAMLYPLCVSGKRASPGPRLCLWRTDVEARPDEPPAAVHCDWAGDWRSLLGYRHWLLRGIQGVIMLLGRFTPDAVAAIWRAMAGRAVQHCAATLSQATFVETSRLHGHILATLLGVPNRLYDNSYGKNRAYYECWHADHPRTTMKAPAGEARPGAKKPRQ
ncbi:polysaccharide pyruvyl transferase family protein [uncultured Thiohalocapsa sp.]|uniref:polysaccharide pyruvyl transferase family protein n=1 Tax=uncultured Thiohalocapsa sp. TaxID=768990 RepID=UPI0025E79CBD|nr:polysaccharide pyruvyl transferase family protein [uncultured Thiohalocapsa sp.]